MESKRTPCRLCSQARRVLPARVREKLREKLEALERKRQQSRAKRPSAEDTQ